VGGGIRSANVFAIWVAIFCASGACSQGKPAAGGPGGHGGGGGMAPLPCAGNTTCNPAMPSVVYSCEPDGTNLPVDTCQADLACSLGRCVSQSCATAELQPSIAGCLFYTAVLDNVDADEGKPTLIVVTNPGDADATVELEERAAGSEWMVAQSIPVPARSANSFSVVAAPIAVSVADAASGPSAPVARRLTSQVPVTVMLVQSDNADGTATSSSGTLILPAHALGTRYMVMAYPQHATDKVESLAGSWGGAQEVAIVATQDRTSLWIYPPSPMSNAMPKTVTLDADGDVYQLTTANEGDDLSGSIIVTDKRVAVFSGNVATTYGLTSSGVNSADMAMEQMTPTAIWSRNYVAARLQAQTEACTPLFEPGVMSYWQILALEEGDVTFITASGQPLPGLPAQPVHMLRGKRAEYWVSSPEDFLIRATQPILVTQGMDCEPSLASAIPLDAPSDLQLFTLAPNFDHMLAIVRKNLGDGARVALDGLDITDQFVLVAGGFEVARVEVPICYGGVDQCVHRLTGAYGMTLRGMNVGCSYSTTFPSWTMCHIDGCY
jgi:IgGFc binding protein